MKLKEIEDAITASLEESEYSIIPDYDDFGDIYFHKESHIHKVMFEILEIESDYDKSKVEIILDNVSSILRVYVGLFINTGQLRNIILDSWIANSIHFHGLGISMVLPDTVRTQLEEAIEKSVPSDYVYTTKETYIKLFFSMGGKLELFTIDSYDYNEKTEKITLKRETKINPNHYGVQQYELKLDGMDVVCVADLGNITEVALVEVTDTRFNKKIKPLLDDGTNIVVLAPFRTGYVGFEINGSDENKFLDETHKRWYRLLPQTTTDNDDEKDV